MNDFVISRDIHNIESQKAGISYFLKDAMRFKDGYIDVMVHYKIVCPGGVDEVFEKLKNEPLIYQDKEIINVPFIKIKGIVCPEEILEENIEQLKLYNNINPNISHILYSGNSSPKSACMINVNEENSSDVHDYNSIDEITKIWGEPLEQIEAKHKILKKKDNIQNYLSSNNLT